MTTLPIPPETRRKPISVSDHIAQREQREELLRVATALMAAGLARDGDADPEQMVDIAAMLIASVNQRFEPEPGA